MAQGTYERKISTKKYLLAFLLSSLIFIIGLLVGFTLTQERTDYLEGIAYKQKLDYESLQLQLLYLDLNPTNQSCSILNNILISSLDDVGSAQIKIDNYIKESRSKKESYTDLKRDYALAQIRYWLLSSRIKENCKSQQVAVLYFYSNEECFECGAQGTILLHLKDRLKDNLLVFSLDVDFKDEAMIQLLKQTYNISKVPSVVVDEEVSEGLTSRDILLDSICEKYEIPPKTCEIE